MPSGDQANECGCPTSAMRRRRPAFGRADLDVATDGVGDLPAIGRPGQVTGTLVADRPLAVDAGTLPGGATSSRAGPPSAGTT